MSLAGCWIDCLWLLAGCLLLGVVVLFGFVFPMGYFWRDGLLFAVVLRRLVVRVVGICL